MIDLEKQADEAELAFIEANKNIKTVDDERRAKMLLGEYLKILKLLRFKRNTLAKMMSLRPYQNALKQPHTRIVGG